MRKNLHIYIFIAAFCALLSARAKAQTVGDPGEAQTVHSAMTADQEDFDSLGCDTLAFVPSTGDSDSVFINANTTPGSSPPTQPITVTMVGSVSWLPIVNT